MAGVAVTVSLDFTNPIPLAEKLAKKLLDEGLTAGDGTHSYADVVEVLAFELMREAFRQSRRPSDG